jgi:tricorn protease-like protein
LDVRTGVARDVTKPILSDSSPAWDPAGDYLYFLSSRELEPAYDAARFGLSFHGSEKPHCVALRKDVRNPLLRALRPPHDGSSSSSDDEYETSDSDDDGSSSSDETTTRLLRSTSISTASSTASFPYPCPPVDTRRSSV